MKLLVTGGGGMLAQAIAHRARDSGHELIALTRAQLDVRDPAAVAAAISAARPAAVIQCAAFTGVDLAESDAQGALAINAVGAGNVARACNLVGATFVYPSSDYVFDGSANAPYAPDAPTGPINAYGRSKLAGEVEARGAGRHLIVRTSWLYGAGGRNFVATILKRAASGAGLYVVTDQRGCPTWTVDLAVTVLRLLELEAASGVYHACNSGQATWFDLAREALQLAGLNNDVAPTNSAEFPRPARRPAYSVLDCTQTERLVGPLRHWRLALADALRAGV